MRKLSSTPSIALGERTMLRGMKTALGIGTCVALTASVIAIAAPKIAVKFEGEIARECAVDQSGQQDIALEIGDVSRPGTKDFTFTVNCNTPFDYHLEAEHGALLLKGVGAGSRSNQVRVPYEVAVRIGTDAEAIEDRCSSESIQAGAVRCAFSNSGNAIAMGTAGRLTVAWAPEGMPMAGEYADRLTILVNARQ